MTHLFRVIAILLCFSAITACSGGDREDMKSPCVGAEGSPCGDRHPVNAWWLA